MYDPLAGKRPGEGFDCGTAVADKSSDPLPEYRNPPVIEVVCGLTFTPLQRFQAVHIGLLWEQIRSGFPKVEEHPPLTTQVEQLDLPTAPTSEFELMATPPLPRVWFLDEPGNGILQVQRDALLHNWRKLSPEDQYPRFKNVFASFTKHLETFTRFVADNQLGAITPVQCELTYVNHIFPNALWSEGKSVGVLFPDFAWNDSTKRFLPIYEGSNWRSAFRLPDRLGRLHANLQLGVLRPTGKALLALEMKARGVTDPNSLERMASWFEVAHEWIVRGFTDMTSERAQKELWGRTR